MGSDIGVEPVTCNNLVLLCSMLHLYDHLTPFRDYLGGCLGQSCDDPPRAAVWWGKSAVLNHPVEDNDIEMEVRPRPPARPQHHRLGDVGHRTCDPCRHAQLLVAQSHVSHSVRRSVLASRPCSASRATRSSPCSAARRTAGPCLSTAA